MPEKLSLTNPAPAATEYEPFEVYMRLGKKAVAGAIVIDPAGAVCEVKFIADNGHVIEDRWEGLEAHSDVLALNKANLAGAGGTLHKRLFLKAIQHGKLAGTVEGTAD